MTDTPVRMRVRDLDAWYGPSRALNGVSLHVPKGEIVTLIGRNGAGKTTTLKSMIGLMDSRKGSILVGDVETIGKRPEQIARLGMAFCPEERGIFSELTVAENLVLPPVLRPGGLAKEEIDGLFPQLKERAGSPGTKLSGGEQQMLAIARILRTGADLLLLDEPTEGLAPAIVKQIGSLIENLKRRGYTIVLVEQNFSFALRHADRHFVMESGSVVDEFDREIAQRRPESLKRYVQV